MSVPGQNHRDPWFADFFKACLDESRMIYGSPSDATPFIFPGTGTGGWEAALTNTLSPGDKVVTFRFGQFSHLWVDMMQRMGLDVEVIDRPWGEGADEEALEKILKADAAAGGKVKAVCVVHNETTTGVTSDIAGVRAAMDAAKHPALLLVDGVSSIAGVNFEMDKWGVDVAVTGSQKALSLPTGLALVAASPKALAAMKTATSKRCYFDFADQLKTNPSGSVPYTPCLSLLYGLRESLALLRAEGGMPAVAARHHRLAEGTRRAVAGWGLELLCRDPRWQSDSLTVIEVPPSVDSGKIVKAAYGRYNLSLGVGLARVGGKVFRIGHLGNNDELMMCAAISGAEMALIDAGVPGVKPGSGIGAAVDYWQKTGKVIPTREA